VKPFDYLLLLAAVILGLALSDIALSTQRLLNASARVKWDWLAPLATLVAFLKIQTQWWAWFGGDRIASALTFEMFTGFLLRAGLLFLLAATALPDEIDRHGIDLRVYFSQVRRRYWILFALHFVVVNIVTVWAQVQVAGAHFVLSTPGLLILPVVIALAFVRSRWVHGLALFCFAVLYLVQGFGHTLGD